MDINDFYKVKIIDTNESGAGIAKIDSAVVFVKGAVCGDEAGVRITAHRKNYFVADVVEFYKKSTNRSDEQCVSFGKCAGCSLDNINFDYENIIKRNTVKSAFRRMGLGDVNVAETVSDGLSNKYRNKLKLHYKNGKFGYFREKTNDLIDYRGCRLCPDLFNEIVDILNRNSAVINESGPYELQIKSSRADDVNILLFTKKKVSNVAREKLLCLVQENVGEKVKIRYFNEDTAEKEIGYICDEIGGIRMRFTSDAFRQVNTTVFEKLLSVVFGMTDELEINYALDLYCGSGIIGLYLAKKYPEVKFYGIEINPDAIKDAKYNAESNEIGNIKFCCCDSSEFKKRLPCGFKPDLVTLDPPRAGLSKETLVDLIEMSPDNIVYVSCNPQTLARDVKVLTESGYSVGEVVPVNMFPRTRHVETVCLLSKLNTKQHIEINLDMDELDLTDAEKKATYQEIKDYVLEHSGLKVSSLYIAQVKQQCGIIERENYNKPKSEDAKQPQCPPDKEKAIKEALKHFGMI